MQPGRIFHSAECALHKPLTFVLKFVRAAPGFAWGDQERGLFTSLLLLRSLHHGARRSVGASCPCSVPPALDPKLFSHGFHGCLRSEVDAEVSTSAPAKTVL